MIHLRVCFPYGIEAAIEAGHGRMVRLRVTEATTNNDSEDNDNG